MLQRPSSMLLAVSAAIKNKNPVRTNLENDYYARIVFLLLRPLTAVITQHLLLNNGVNQSVYERYCNIQGGEFGPKIFSMAIISTFPLHSLISTLIRVLVFTFSVRSNAHQSLMNHSTYAAYIVQVNSTSLLSLAPSSLQTPRYHISQDFFLTVTIKKPSNQF